MCCSRRGFAAPESTTLVANSRQGEIPVRDNYFVNWSFAIQGSLQKVVKQNFQHEAYRWPSTKEFDSEGYIWESSHLIIVLRDKMSGIPAMGKVIEDDGKDLPSEKPTVRNGHLWQNLARKKYRVNPQDVLMVIPILGSGPKTEGDWAKWNDEDKELWHWEINYNIQVHFYLLKGFDKLGNFFLPPGYVFLADQCKRFLVDHPNYDRNVFIMTRFVKDNRLLETLDQELRQVLRDHSLNPLRADDRMYMPDRNLWNNVCVYMLSCKHGIAILEDRVADEFNPNIAIEYGFMRALNKSVLLLADTGFRNLRADIIGTLREQFDITDIGGTIRPPVEKWLKEIGAI